MDIIGEKFKNNEVFVPEVLVAARAIEYGSVPCLSLCLADGDNTSAGRVCIGTVRGDLHDIGKNLVKMMMEGRGLKVIDLGVNVPAENILRPPGTAAPRSSPAPLCSPPRWEK